MIKLILAIDTSCDETATAVSYKDRILSNIISSQIKYHKEFGGVVPNLAKRKHEELIDGVIKLALKYSRKKIEDIDAFAVTYGPGLAPALEVGLSKAKELSLKYSKPLIPVNHMEGHIYSCFAKNSKGKPSQRIKFPLIAVLISGGHTEFVLMKDHGDYKIIGSTLDDAIGECYDKVGRMLGLGYPAGQIVEEIARSGNENRFLLPIAMRYTKDANMSYSGLKTAVMQLIAKEENNLNKNTISDIAASFQKAAIEQLIIKLRYALSSLDNIENIIISGGVSQNKYLRKKLRKSFSQRLYFPTNKKLYTDNAGMICVAGYFNALNNKILKTHEKIKSIDREPGLSFE